MKEIVLMACQTAVGKMMKSFSSVLCEHVHRAYDKHFAALVTLAPKIDILDKEVDVRIMKRIL